MRQLHEGAIVTPKENYRQQNGESGKKLQLGEEYVVKSWFPFGNQTILVLETGQYVYKVQVRFV